MNVTVIGAGYVGLVTSACFSEVGNCVVSYDSSMEKVQMLQSGKIPIYEPGLEDIIERNVESGRLSFTFDLELALRNADVVFIAVGTPPRSDGSADLTSVLDVATSVGSLITKRVVIVTKSTVPVGTSEKVRAVIASELERRSLSITFSVVSNPEFLKEGAAISDFLKPDRIIVGCDDDLGRNVMTELYAPFERNRPCVIEMDLRSSELTKYASNAMLATRISLMNEMARIADLVGADIELVRIGVGSDPRIGSSFLYAGCGYGGSCFPKDLRALIHLGTENGIPMRIMQAVEQVNEDQKLVVFEKIHQFFDGNVRGRTVAVLGLTFKPDTDDLRESPSLSLIRRLLLEGASVKAFDPVGNRAGKEAFPTEEEFRICDNIYEAANGSDALALVTDWKQFRSVDFGRIRRVMKRPIIFDGRNQWDPRLLRSMGFVYHGIGRQ